MSGAITRTTWIDDDGSNTVGTPLINARLQDIYNVVESIVGANHEFGGDPNEAVAVTSYPTGATLDTLHKATSIWIIDSAKLFGSYALEGMGQVASGTTMTVGIFNLSDGAPNTPLAEFTITTSSAPSRGVTGTITFAASGAAKTYGVKVKVDTGEGFVWGLRIIRTGS
jgi:hypothetical protein